MNRRRLSKITIYIMLGILVSVTSIFFLKEFISNYFVRLTLNNIEVPDSSSRVLVFAPHNDDEVLGAGDLIKRTLANNGKVKVVLITNGDGYKNAVEFNDFKLIPKPKDYIEFGYARQKETLQALKLMGLSEDNVVFLGYPDGGVASLWNTNWDKDTPYTSKFTQTSHSPYENSMTKSVPYTGENLVSDLIKIIAEYKPTHIVYPHPNDRHPDHWATNAFIKLVLTEMNYRPKNEWLYLVHRGDWPTPLRADTRMFLTPPAKLMRTGTDWHALDMSSAEVSQKVEAIHLYKTQIKLSVALPAFERKSELFGEYSDVILRSHLASNSDIAPTQINQVIIDPIDDTLGLQVSKEGDLTSVFAEISTENNLNIIIEANERIEKLTTYKLNIVFFNKGIAKRMNLEIKGNKIEEQGVSKTSIHDISAITIENENGRLRVIIPFELSGRFDHLFINAESLANKQLLDKTAWRMCQMP